MKYRDTESGEILTKEQLYAEYLENADDLRENSEVYNFGQWLNNATDKNGFLEEVKQ